MCVLQVKMQQISWEKGMETEDVVLQPSALLDVLEVSKTAHLKHVLWMEVHSRKGSWNYFVSYNHYKQEIKY